LNLITLCRLKVDIRGIELCRLAPGLQLAVSRGPLAARCHGPRYRHLQFRWP
jgi:hypothetical protein